MTHSGSHVHPEQDIEKGKYALDAIEFAVDAGAPLPEGYGDNRLVILARDPYWFFSYWEITHERAEEARQHHGRDSWDKAGLILRAYDLGEEEREDVAGAPFTDVDVQKQARQWYVQVLNSGHFYMADLGLRWPDGRFVPLVRSNRIRMPYGRVSDQSDSQWMAVGHAQHEWETLLKVAVPGGSSGAHGSAEFARGMAQRWEFLRAIFSGSVSSWPSSKFWASSTASATAEKEKS